MHTFLSINRTSCACVDKGVYGQRRWDRFCIWCETDFTAWKFSSGQRIGKSYGNSRAKNHPVFTTDHPKSQAPLVLPQKKTRKRPQTTINILCVFFLSFLSFIFSHFFSSFLDKFSSATILTRHFYSLSLKVEPPGGEADNLDEHRRSRKTSNSIPPTKFTWTDRKPTGWQRHENVTYWTNLLRALKPPAFHTAFSQQR